MVPSSEEELIFADAKDTGTVQERSVWRILIVDDNADVHSATKLALHDTLILDRSLEFFDAYSVDQAIEQLRTLEDLAVVLLDVVMEQEDSGLQLVKQIRNELKMSDLRIILRTGQPGYAPEMDAVRDLDINDYKIKTELNRTRLYATLTTAVRSYDQLARMRRGRRGFEQITLGTDELILSKNQKEFASNLLKQISLLIESSAHGLVCSGLTDQRKDTADNLILAATGHYLPYVDQTAQSIGNKPLLLALEQSSLSKANQFKDNFATFYIGSQTVFLSVFLEHSRPFDLTDQNLINLFCNSASVCLQNLDLMERLAKQAYFDSSVLLPNRAYFLGEINKLLVNIGSRQGLIALVDVDHFAEINDALGHAYGDKLLKSIANRIRQFMPSEALVARVGGDVFGVFVDEFSLDPDAILKLFSEPFKVDEDSQSVTVTMGLAQLKEMDGTADEAYKSAGIALKRAQINNRGHFAYYNRSLGTETRERVKLLRDLRSAFDCEHLYLNYQPQVALRNGKVVGCEALIRWRTEAGKFVPPDAFIPLAEQSGLIVSIGEWVLRTACLQSVRIEQEFARGLRMAINVSALQFKHPEFLAVLDRALAETGVNPALIELEITESVAMLDANFIVDMIHKIKQRGVQIAIDDFGTGFSSLAYLQQLKVDRLKIDRSFIIQLSKKKEQHAIANMVIDLGKNLGFEVIAEGVEDVSQAMLLRSLGCTEGQGYLFAKPMMDTALIQWLQNHATGDPYQAELSKLGLP
jgi:diguanylate cyclase